MRVHGQDLDRGRLARLAGDLSALGGVRSVVLDDGAERGIRALEFRTGSGLASEAGRLANGSMIWLTAGESRSYHTHFSILAGETSISEAVRTIQARQVQPASDGARLNGAACLGRTCGGARVP